MQPVTTYKLYPGSVRSGKRFRPVVRMFDDRGAPAGAKYSDQTFSTSELARMSAFVSARIVAMNMMDNHSVNVIVSD